MSLESRTQSLEFKLSSGELGLLRTCLEGYALTCVWTSELSTFRFRDSIFSSRSTLLEVLETCDRKMVPCPSESSGRLKRVEDSGWQRGLRSGLVLWRWFEYSSSGWAAYPDGLLERGINICKWRKQYLNGPTSMERGGKKPHHSALLAVSRQKGLCHYPATKLLMVLPSVQFCELPICRASFDIDLYWEQSISIPPSLDPIDTYLA